MIMNKAIIGAILSCFVWINFAQAEPIKVVASIAPLYDFANEIGKEKVNVNLLLPPGASPHVFEPTPRTIQEISEADIFIKIGAGLEFWAEKFVKASANKKLLIINSSSGVNLIKDAHSHGVSENNPHIWLDPLLVKKQAETIRDALIRLDPQGESLYRKNYGRFAAELDALHAELRKTLAPLTGREFFVYHPSYGYLADRYSCCFNLGWAARGRRESVPTESQGSRVGQD